MLDYHIGDASLFWYDGGCHRQEKDGPEAEKRAVGLAQKLKDDGTLKAFGGGNQVTAMLRRQEPPGQSQPDVPWRL